MVRCSPMCINTLFSLEVTAPHCWNSAPVVGNRAQLGGGSLVRYAYKLVLTASVYGEFMRRLGFWTRLCRSTRIVGVSFPFLVGTLCTSSFLRPLGLTGFVPGRFVVQGRFSLFVPATVFPVEPTGVTTIVEMYFCRGSLTPLSTRGLG